MPHRNDHQAALARATALEAENARLRKALESDGLASANYRLGEAKQELAGVNAQLERAAATVNGWWWALLVTVVLVSWALAVDPNDPDGKGTGLIVVMAIVGAFAIYRIVVNSRPAKRAARRSAIETLKDQRTQLSREIEDLHGLFRTPDDSSAEP